MKALLYCVFFSFICKQILSVHSCTCDLDSETNIDERIQFNLYCLIWILTLYCLNRIFWKSNSYTISLSMSGSVAGSIPCILAKIHWVKVEDA